MPGHEFKLNDIAGQLGRRGSLLPFIRHEPAGGISERNWVCRAHQGYWQSTPGKRYSKSLIPELKGLSLSPIQFRQYR
jgi:hypothetical protein